MFPPVPKSQINLLLNPAKLHVEAFHRSKLYVTDKNLRFYQLQGRLVRRVHENFQLSGKNLNCQGDFLCVEMNGGWEMEWY